RVDKNGDGVITPTEAIQSRDYGINGKIVHEIFQLIDLNNDGKITFAEFTSVMDGNSNVQPKAQMKGNQNLAHQLMTLIDQNFDQKLSVQEVRTFADANIKKSETELIKAFGYIDSDHNGFLTINEIIAESEKMVALVHFQEPPSVIGN
ncbi:hypothetical protein LOAG_09303, partial [Loa loa]